jgi:hypothetical protein
MKRRPSITDWNLKLPEPIMTPLFLKLINGTPLMIIPDTEAHLDGHTILTYTYSIFLDKKDGDIRQAIGKENALHLSKHTDPDYYGYITFEKPGKLFSYTPDGKQKLTRNELEEIIERLTYIRDHPSLWQHIDNL